MNACHEPEEPYRKPWHGHFLHFEQKSKSDRVGSPVAIWLDPCGGLLHGDGDVERVSRGVAPIRARGASCVDRDRVGAGRCTRMIHGLAQR